MPTHLPPFTWTSYNPVATRRPWRGPIVAVSCFLVGVGIGHFSAVRDASPHITLTPPGSIAQVQGDLNGARLEPLSSPSGPASAPPAALVKEQSPEPVPAIIINPNSTAPARQAIPARPTPSTSTIPHRERERSSGSSDYSDFRRSLLQE